MKIRRSIITWICLVSLLFSMLPISAFAAEAQWNGSNTSAENNSTTTAPVPVQPEQIVKAWQAEVGTGTVTIVGDYIYTYDGYDFGGSISKGGTLYQIDAQTGEIVKQVKSTVRRLFG